MLARIDAATIPYARLRETGASAKPVESILVRGGRIAQLEVLKNYHRIMTYPTSNNKYAIATLGGVVKTVVAFASLSSAYNASWPKRFARLAGKYFMPRRSNTCIKT